jgi:hypothetical protein
MGHISRFARRSQTNSEYGVWLREQFMSGSVSAILRASVCIAIGRHCKLFVLSFAPKSELRFRAFNICGEMVSGQQRVINVISQTPEIDLCKRDRTS